MFLFHLIKRKMESKRMAKLKEQRNKFDEICKNKNFVELTDEEMKNIRG